MKSSIDIFKKPCDSVRDNVFLASSFT